MYRTWDRGADHGRISDDGRYFVGDDAEANKLFNIPGHHFVLDHVVDTSDSITTVTGCTIRHGRDF